MLILSIISVVSFLVLVAMVSLRWFNCSLSHNSICHRIYRKSDDYLDKQFFFLKQKSEKYKQIVPWLVWLKNFILFFFLKIYNGLIGFLREKNDKFGRFLRRVSLKKKGESVSDYLRSVSDYKNVSEE